MSESASESTFLRPSLKKQPPQGEVQTRDSNMKRHVTFVSPNSSSYMHKILKHQHPVDGKSGAKVRRQKADMSRKRLILSGSNEDLRTKKVKHNEEIVRLCEAQSSLINLWSVISRVDKRICEPKYAAGNLLADSVTLIETDVLRSFEAHRIVELLNSGEQRHEKCVQELNDKLIEYDKKSNAFKKILEEIQKSNRTLDSELHTADAKKDLSIAEELKLFVDDVTLYCSVIESLRQLQL